MNPFLWGSVSSPENGCMRIDEMKVLFEVLQPCRLVEGKGSRYLGWGTGLENFGCLCSQRLIWFPTVLSSSPNSLALTTPAPGTVSLDTDHSGWVPGLECHAPFLPGEISLSWKLKRRLKSKMDGGSVQTRHSYPSSPECLAFSRRLKKGLLLYKQGWGWLHAT